MKILKQNKMLVWILTFITIFCAFIGVMIPNTGHVVLAEQSEQITNENFPDTSSWVETPFNSFTGFDGKFIRIYMNNSCVSSSINSSDVVYAVKIIIDDYCLLARRSTSVNGMFASLRDEYGIQPETIAYYSDGLHPYFDIYITEGTTYTIEVFNYANGKPLSPYYFEDGIIAGNLFDPCCSFIYELRAPVEDSSTEESFPNKTVDSMCLRIISLSCSLVFFIALIILFRDFVFSKKKK